MDRQLPRALRGLLSSIHKCSIVGYLGGHPEAPVWARLPAGGKELDSKIDRRISQQ